MSNFLAQTPDCVVEFVCYVIDVKARGETDEMASLLLHFATSFIRTEKRVTRRKLTPFQGEESNDLRSFLEWYQRLDVRSSDIDEPCLVVCTESTQQYKVERKTVNGKVTTIFDNGHGLVDHHIYFTMKDMKGFKNNDCPAVGDLVNVEAEKCRNDGGWKALSVVPVKQDTDWNAENPDFRIPTHYEEQGSMIGILTLLDAEKQSGIIENVIEFCHSELTADYNPQVGDWIKCQVLPGGLAENVEPLRVKDITGVVTYTRVEGRCFVKGTINNEISFDKECCKKNYSPRRGDHVSATVVECKQDRYTWRAAEVELIQRGKCQTAPPVISAKKSNWVLSGVKPNFSDRNTNLPSFLPQFSVPESLTKCLETGGNLLAVRPVLKQPLTQENYYARFSTLLHLEEISLQKEIDALQMQNVSLSCQGEYLVLAIPGISDGRPSLVVGDSLLLHDMDEASAGPQYRGFIHYIHMESEEVLLKFHHQLHIDFDETVRYNVSFSFSRVPFRRCHLATQYAKQNYAAKSLFSDGDIANFPPIIDTKLDVQEDSSVKIKFSTYSSKNPATKYASFYSPSLNDRQRKAVVRILRGEARQKPYIIFGPPGTGKTVTLVEAVLQILQHFPSCRLLLCAPSNSAVDLLCEKLHASGQVSSKMMVRFNAFRRPEQAIPKCIQPYCHTKDHLRVTAHYKIVLSTCVNSGMFYTLQLRSDHFTHVCIDESGQATEPETLIPIGLCPKGQVVLTGDPEQLGAVLKSPFAIHYQLGISLLERLMSLDIYQRDATKYAEGYNDLLVTKLVNNYRSHSAIIDLPSQLFYHGELKASADISLQTALCSWGSLPVKDLPLFFHPVVGKELQESDCLSYFNPSEIVQVVHYTKQLLASKFELQACDIGIITPYRKQVEKLRLMLKTMRIEGLKVGSVEEFQGQERKAVIVSTVRSRLPEELENSDPCLRTLLGFVSSPKRFNVAVTRAQSLLIVVGNPSILRKDEYWRSFLEYCVKHKAYIHIDS